MMAHLALDDGWLIVDVRTEPEFLKTRIPGSINIPLHQVKAKRFLRVRPFVLVDRGYSVSWLQAEVEKLISGGFTGAMAMSGGLKAWRELGGGLEGDLRPQQELDWIPVLDFVAGLKTSDWIIVDATEDQDSTVLADRAVPIDELQAKLDEAGVDRLIPVIVVDDDGEAVRAVMESIGRTAGAVVYGLEDGMKAYHEFVELQAQMAAGGKTVVSSPGGVGSPGCASCP
ncbi:MAG: rhodanese-like domain-containing protein [Verrucomicrobia bacterium]|nr:rhodanese-like domain-containing protein [Verrucomicrobiota bacterium]